MNNLQHLVQDQDFQPKELLLLIKDKENYRRKKDYQDVILLIANLDMKMLSNLLQFGSKHLYYFQLFGLFNLYLVKMEEKNLIKISKLNTHLQKLNIHNIKKKKNVNWLIKIEKKVKVINSLLIKENLAEYLQRCQRNQLQKSLSIYQLKEQVKIINKKKGMLKEIMMVLLLYGQMNQMKNQCSYLIIQIIYLFMTAISMQNLHHGANLHLMWT